MHHGDVVRVDAPPVWQPVKQGDSRRGRREQCRAYAVFIEQPQKVGKILQAQCPVMTENVRLAVKLGAAIDEWRNPDKIQIAAKIVVIKNRTCAGHVDRMDCTCWRDFVSRATLLIDARPVMPASRIMAAAGAHPGMRMPELI